MKKSITLVQSSTKSQIQNLINTTLSEFITDNSVNQNANTKVYISNTKSILPVLPNSKTKKEENDFNKSTTVLEELSTKLNKTNITDSTQNTIDNTNNVVTENTEENTEEIPKSKNYYISYSQYSTFKRCIREWYTKYILKIKDTSQNQFAIFGTAIHKTVQLYLNELYNNSKVSANKIDLNTEFTKDLIQLFENNIESTNKIISKQFISDFFEPGKLIITEFKKKWFDYFNVRDYELIGNEYNLEYQLYDNIYFTGYVDTIIKNKITNKYTIIDFKTSTRGWSKKEKQDDMKKAQLLLYKYFYSIQNNIPLDDIDIMFIVFKRVIYENPNMEFKISRIQKIEVPSKRATVKTYNEFMNFINIIRDKYGNAIIQKSEITQADDRKKCIYCMYKDNPTYCIWQRQTKKLKISKNKNITDISDIK